MAQTVPAHSNRRLYSTNRTYLIHKGDEEVKWNELEVPFRYKDFYNKVVNAFSVGTFERQDMNLFYMDDNNDTKPLTCDLDLVCIHKLSTKCIHVHVEIPPIHPEDAELRYHSELGHGKYGVVKLCINQKGEPIALKQIKLRQSAVGVQDILQEIQTLERLNHKSIVKYLGTRRDADSFYIMLEYVPMGSLKKLLERMKRFGEESIASYLRQVLRALSYLHSQGVIHHDIKCDNVLVDADGRIKLADFGCAKVLQIQRRDEKANSTMVAGTLAYLSPEVLNGKEPTFACDIWALGCMAIELFTGRMAWEEFIMQQNWSKEETSIRLKEHIKSGNIPPYPKDEEEISPIFRSFLEACLEPDISRRSTVDVLLKHPFIANEGRTDEIPMDVISSNLTPRRLRLTSNVFQQHSQEILYATPGFEDAKIFQDFQFVMSAPTTKFAICFYKEEIAVSVNKIPLKDILECKIGEYIELIRQIEEKQLKKIAKTYCVIKSEKHIHIVQEAFDLDWDNLFKQLGDHTVNCVVPQLIIALNELNRIGFECVFLSENYIEFVEDGHELKLKNIGVERILQAHTVTSSNLEKGNTCAPEVLEFRAGCNPDSYLVGSICYGLLAFQNKKIPLNVRFENEKIERLIDEAYLISNDPLLRQFLHSLLQYHGSKCAGNRPKLSDLRNDPFIQSKQSTGKEWNELSTYFSQQQQ